MCEQCEKSGSAVSQAKQSRIKLWQLARHLHCPVIGTCLSMNELRKIQRKCQLGLPTNCSDYDLHAGLVGQAEYNAPPARQTHKLLDRKYARWVKTYGQLRSHKEREKFWRDALIGGELSGPFWALLSHSATSTALRERALGDVHMLSHLQGAANRADLRRTAHLEREVAELKQALSEARQLHQRKQEEQSQLLNAQHKALQAMNDQLQAAPKSTSEQQQALEQQLAESHKQQRLLTKRQDWMTAQLAQKDQRITELEHGQEGLLEQLQETQQERDALESAVNALLLQQHKESMTDSRAEIDLQGKRLAYVGGRASNYPRLKALVEAHNGELAHHDGGVEDSRAELCNCLSGADLVFCPVDCVSHDACLRVKKFCKQHDKPFVPLRSASLSAFSNGLKVASTTSPEVSPRARPQ